MSKPGRRVTELTGMKVGDLTVSGRGDDYVSPKGARKARWWCQCSCGSEPVLVVAPSLTNGLTQSCGCKRIKELKSRAIKRQQILAMMSEEDKKEMMALDVLFQNFINKAEKLGLV